MRIMVTGSTGLLGDAVLRKASLAGLEVVEVNRRIVPDLSSGEAKNLLHQLGSIDAVVHTAAMIPTGDNDRVIEKVNRQIDTNVFECAVASNAFIVYISSISLFKDYGTGNLITEDSPLKEDNEFSPYQRAKVESEKCLESFSSSAVFRVSSPYGINQTNRNVLSIFIERVLASKTIEVSGKGLRTQDFIFADDIADAALRAISLQARGLYNMGSGRSVSMLELAELISGMGVKGHKVIMTGEESNSQDNFQVAIDMTRAKQHLDWAASTSLADGIGAVMSAWGSR